jgi:hypothetical protein
MARKLDNARRHPLAAILCGVGLALLAEGEATTDAPAPEIPPRKWIHVANEGAYQGHADGKFSLTREVFQSFIKNLRADPRYKAGADGVGSQPVIPFDYEHASELDPTSGSIPASGAGAPGWALDFKIENGQDGKAQLWAFAQLGDTIRKQISAKEYLFTSIAFVLQSTDPVSATETGPRITSIAFTNHPFLRDLIPLAARAQGLRYYYGDRAGSRGDGLHSRHSRPPADRHERDRLCRARQSGRVGERPGHCPARRSPGRRDQGSTLRVGRPDHEHAGRAFEPC